MANLINGSKSTPATEDILIGSSLDGGDEGINLDGKAILQPNMSEEDLEKQKKLEEYKEELAKIQEDIATLRLVLNDKMKRENELKTLMGVTFVDEMRQDITEGFNTIKSTLALDKVAQSLSDFGASVTHNEAYQKTATGLKTATSKITPSFANIGTSMKSSLGSLRNSSMFTSFSNGISSLTPNKMKSSQSEFNIDSDTSEQHGPNTMPTSKSTLGNTTSGGNGVTKHDAILED